MIRKVIASLLSAFLFCGFFSVTASALDYTWKDEILEFAKYCETHTYKERLDYFICELGDGDGFFFHFKEEDLQFVQSGRNALIVVKYRLEEKLYSDVKFPSRAIFFHAYMSDGAKSTFDPFGKNSVCKHVLTERNVFTVKEHLLEMGVEDPKGLLLFPINYADPFASGIDVLGYELFPCENGWNEIDGARYYVKKDGTLATGSLTVNGIRYKFGKDGVCQGKFTGKIRSGNNVICYKDGVKQEEELFTGWIKFGGKRFYAKDGVIQRGWVNISPEWYYIDPKEGRLTGTHEIDGASCTFDKNGKWDKKTKKHISTIFTYVEYKMDENLFGGVYIRDGMLMVWSVDGKAEKKLQKRYPNNGGIYYMEAKYSMAEMNAIIDELWARNAITSSMVDVFNNRLKLGFTDKQLKRIQPYLDSLENKDCIVLVDETGVIFYDD